MSNTHFHRARALSRITLFILLTLWGRFPTPSQAQEANWNFTLASPNQLAAPGTTLTYFGTLSNYTGADLPLLSFLLDPPDAMDNADYSLAFTSEFRNALVNSGYLLPVGGYQGSIFQVTLKPGAALGTRINGTVELSMDAPADPITIVQPFSVYLPTSLITGKITLPYLSEQAGDQELVFTFRPTDGGETFTEGVVVGPSGEFSLADVAKKSYTVHIKGGKWLAQNVVVDLSSGYVSGVIATLSPGDANDDNSVDIFDLGTLAEDFNSIPSDLTWNGGRSDFNGDSSVDIFDLAILAEFFNTLGDP